MMLRVLMFSSQFYPIVGGAERQVEKLSKALIELGCQVTVLTPKMGNDSPDRETYNTITVERFTLFDLSRRYPWLRGIGFFNMWLIERQLKQVVARKISQYDVVHCHIASPMSAFVAEVAKQSGVPALCKLASAGDNNDIRKMRQIGFYTKSLVRKMIQQLSCWVATTQAVKTSLLQEGISEQSIQLIPNGVEIPAQIDREKYRQPPRFLFLGRLSRVTERDIPGLVNAFNQVSEAIPDAELAIVGAGDQLEEIRQLANACRYPERIHLPGQQAPEQWLSWANCYVQPSRREGLSNALLEAMANGLACIANDIPANREVLANGQCGLLVPVGDVDALAGAMATLVSAPVRQDWGMRANRHVISTYSIEAVAGRYLALYRILQQQLKAVDSSFQR